MGHSTVRIAIAVAVGLTGCAAIARAAPSAPPAAQGSGAATDIVDTSFATADCARTLQQSVTIAAPAAVLWKAFVDPAEFARWNAPVAAVDLRVGGSLEASYDAAHAIGDPRNIRHRIITFLPQRLIVFQNIQTPPDFPTPEKFQSTVTVLEFEALGPDRTRVTLSSTGWGKDAQSERLYRFFAASNADLLTRMNAVYGRKPPP